MMNCVNSFSATPVAPGPALPDPAATPAEHPAAFAQALDRAAQAQTQDNGADPSPDSPADGGSAPMADADCSARRAAVGKHLPCVALTMPTDAASLAAPATELDDKALGAVEAKAAAQDGAQRDDAAMALLDLAALLSGLPHPAKAPQDTVTAREPAATGDAVGVAATSDISRARQHSALANARPELAATPDPGQAAASSLGLESRSADLAGAWTAAFGQRDGSSPRHAPDGPLGHAISLAPPAALGAAPGSRAAESAAPFQADLLAAVGTPEFAPALGAQVSVLIRDGVSQARLHLNPADMGPISVHIRLDGDSARVDFSALQALTRQALEEAVPALASALRESGLTLSGGGVFEQPRQQRDPPSAATAHHADTAPHSTADSSDTAALRGALSRAARPRGMVDLYA